MARDYFTPLMFTGDPATTHDPTPTHFRIMQREDAFLPDGSARFQIPTVDFLAAETLYELPATWGANDYGTEDADAYVYSLMQSDSTANVMWPVVKLSRPLTYTRDWWKKIRVHIELGQASNEGVDGSGNTDKAANVLFPNWGTILEIPVWQLFDFNPFLSDNALTAAANRYLNYTIGIARQSLGDNSGIATTGADRYGLVRATPAQAYPGVARSAMQNRWTIASDFAGDTDINKTAVEALGWEEEDIILAQDDASSAGAGDYFAVQIDVIRSNGQLDVVDYALPNTERGATALSATRLGKYNPDVIEHLGIVNFKEVAPFSKMRIDIGA